MTIKRSAQYKAKKAKQKAVERRAQYEEIWAAQYQRWLAHRLQCDCVKPVRGARYFGETWCSRCQKRIPRQRLLS